MSSQKYTTKPFWIEHGLFGSVAYRVLTQRCPTACVVLGLLWERRKAVREQIYENVLGLIDDDESTQLDTDDMDNIPF